MVSAKVAFDWSGEDDDMVSASAGASVEVIENFGDGWCQISLGSKTGIFPTDFLEFDKGPPPVSKEAEENTNALMHESLFSVANDLAEGKAAAKKLAPPPLMSKIKAKPGESSRMVMGATDARLIASSSLDGCMERVERLRLQEDMEKVQSRSNELEAENKLLVSEAKRGEEALAKATQEADDLRSQNAALQQTIEQLKYDIQVEKDFSSAAKEDLERARAQLNTSPPAAIDARRSEDDPDAAAALRKEIENYKKIADLDHKELVKLRKALADEKQAKNKLGSLAKRKLNELQQKSVNHARTLNKRLQNGSDQYKRVVRAHKSAKEQCAALQKQVDALKQEIAKIHATRTAVPMRQQQQMMKPRSAVPMRQQQQMMKPRSAMPMKQQQQMASRSTMPMTMMQQPILQPTLSEIPPPTAPRPSKAKTRRQRRKAPQPPSLM